MAGETHYSIESRLVAQEERTEAIREELGGLRSDIGELTKTMKAGFSSFERSHKEDVDRLHDRITAQQRTPWGTIISCLGVATTLIIAGVSGLMYATTTPINLAIANTQKETSALQRDIERNADRMNAMTTRVAEDSVRFDWLRDALNQYRAHETRLNGIIWRHLFDQELPELSVIPVGPTPRL